MSDELALSCGRVGVIVFWAVTVLACAGTAPPSVPAESACADFSGRWEIETTVDKTACGEGVHAEVVSVTLHQDGCALRMPVSLTESLSGAVSGSRARLSGEYRSLGTISKDLELVLSGDRLSGQGVWRWSGLGAACAGDEALQGRRLP